MISQLSKQVRKTSENDLSNAQNISNLLPEITLNKHPSKPSIQNCDFRLIKKQKSTDISDD